MMAWRSRLPISFKPNDKFRDPRKHHNSYYQITHFSSFNRLTPNPSRQRVLKNSHGFTSPSE